MAASIFKKKPAWLKNKQSSSTPPSKKSENELDMFSRSSHTLTLAEEHHRHKSGEKTEDKSHIPSDNIERTSDTKRRRLSPHALADQQQQRGTPTGGDAPRSPSPVREGGNGSQDVRESIEHDDHADAQDNDLPSNSPASITSESVDEDDGSGWIASYTPKNKRKAGAVTSSLPKVSPVRPAPDPVPVATVESSPEPESGPDDEMDYDRILKRAEKRERRKAREEAAAKAANPETSSTTLPRTNSNTSASAVATAQPDGRLKIFVHSRLPNTKPLFGEVLLSTKLKILKQTWCSRQGFGEEFQKDIFLIWRGLKLFDWTTCRSLGISIDAMGEVRWSSNGRTEQSGSESLEMEAMTEELFVQDREQRMKKPVFQLPGTMGAPTASKAPSEQQSTKLRIIVKAQGYQDYKLIVHPDTTFDKIVSAFRKTRSVPQGKEAYLVFDGDRLDAAGLVKDADIADMDELDLHIK